MGQQNTDANRDGYLHILLSSVYHQQRNRQHFPVSDLGQARLLTSPSLITCLIVGQLRPDVGSGGGHSHARTISGVSSVIARCSCYRVLAAARFCNFDFSHQTLCLSPHQSSKQTYFWLGTETSVVIAIAALSRLVESFQ